VFGLSVCLSVCNTFTMNLRLTSSAYGSVWRILDVIRSGSAPLRRCSDVANWTDSIAKRPAWALRPVRTAGPRLRRRAAAADAEAIIAGRCFTTSPAELRWLLHRLQTAGYRCGADTPPLRHRRLDGSDDDDGQTLQLLATTLTDVPTRGERAVRKDAGTRPEVQDPVLEQVLPGESTLERALSEDRQVPWSVFEKSTKTD